MKARQPIVVFSICIVMLISFFGCSPQKFIKNMAPKESDQFAREYINLVRNENYDKAIKLFDPQFVNDGSISTFKIIHTYLDNGKLLSTELIDYRGTSFKAISGNLKSYKMQTFVYQLHFEKAWVIVNITLKYQDNKLMIYNFSVNEIPKPISELNAFTLSNKTLVHYVILLLAILIPIFIVFSIILCARTKMKKKWLWIIFISLGIGQLSVNWATGQLGFQMLQLQLLGAGCIRSGLYGPWILTVGMPVGAIIFFVKRKSFSFSHAQSKVTSPEENEGIIEKVTDHKDKSDKKNIEEND